MTVPAPPPAHREGLVFGVAAYGIWGLFPLYFPLLAPAGPVEITANRIVWSLAFLVVVLAATHRVGRVTPVLRDRRRLALLGLAAAMIALNWGVYIEAVVSGQVVQAALGYFVNPLVTVVAGVVLLHERLSNAQWGAVALGVVAVGVLTLGYGGVPWVSLVLAFSFATYGFVKKRLDMGAAESLTVEAALLTPLALGYLAWLSAQGEDTFLAEGARHTLLLMSAGVVTAVPLMLFGAAATRIPLTWLGLLQYLTPVMQFVIGVAVFHEPMSAERWVGFALIWAALVVITVDGLAAGRRGSRAALLHAVED